MIVFDKLWLYLDKHGIKQQRLIDNGINRRTIYKLKDNEVVTTDTISRLCDILNCKITDICEYKKIE